jgi:hypothetical protein
VQRPQGALVYEIPTEPVRIMSVADYAQARGKKPQLIHYYIRTGKLIPDECECGRTCVNVEEADLFFKEREEKDG